MRWPPTKRWMARSSKGSCKRMLAPPSRRRSEEHTSELQSPCNLVCRLLLEKKKYSHRPAGRYTTAQNAPSRLPAPAPPLASHSTTLRGLSVLARNTSHFDLLCACKRDDSDI